MEASLQGPFGRTVLGPWVLTIGRATDNRLVINTTVASSHHAEIRPGSSGYSLIDLESTNGTFVNEQQLAPHYPRLLQDGDRIRIGDMVCLYQTGRQDVQMPFVQKSNHTDVPTAKVRAIDVRALGQSERFGDQPPAPYFTYLQQPPVLPTFEQSNTATLSTENAKDIATPEQTLSYASPSIQSPRANSKSINPLKMLLAGLSIILVLGVVGGGFTTYLITRPKPVIAVTSNYHVGSTPAGATGTVLHISAHSFSGASAITFLLDNLPVTSNQNVSSDVNGTVKVDLMITNDWVIGNHTLTAKDASGYATKVGVPVAIVPQGEEHTPGPNGAPPDDMSFTLYASVHIQDAGTGKQLETYSNTLIITGRPDPSGGTVCQYSDDDQQYTYFGNSGNGITYRETYAYSCSGTYKGGKLSYIETTTSEKIYYSNGLSCVAHTPYVHEELEGTFTNQNTISGTLIGDSVTWDCSGGYGTELTNAKEGSWTGQLWF